MHSRCFTKKCDHTKKRPLNFSNDPSPKKIKQIVTLSFATYFQSNSYYHSLLHINCSFLKIRKALLHYMPRIFGRRNFPNLVKFPAHIDEKSTLLHQLLKLLSDRHHFSDRLNLCQSHCSRVPFHPIASYNLVDTHQHLHQE